MKLVYLMLEPPIEHETTTVVCLFAVREKEDYLTPCYLISRKEWENQGGE